MTEEAIFLAAAEIAETVHRDRYLNEACGADAALRRRIENLLAAHELPGDFLEVPAIEQIVRSGSAASDAASISGPVEASPKKTIAPRCVVESQGADEVLAILEPSTDGTSLGRLDHYEIHEVIGKGGFGIVLKAFDTRLHRTVAIKVLSPQLAATSPPRKRFLREARSAAKIRHENVVAVYAVGEQPVPFLVMELIPGETLQQAMNRTGPLAVLDIVRIGRQIAAGLAAAHAIGLIHRDIKPSNILIEAGPDPRVKISDFGLARAVDDASLTQSGAIAGTPMYMAPEQALGQEVDQRADLFSLGSTLYSMCTGRPPFRAPNTMAVLKRVVEEQARPIREVNPDVPDWLCDVVHKLQAKLPADRFQSAREVADLFGRHLIDLERSTSLLAQPNALPPLPAPEMPTPAASIPFPTPAVAETKSPRISRQPSRVLIAVGFLGLLLLSLGLTDAAGVTAINGTIIRFFSDSGTLAIEVEDSDIGIALDGEDVVITGAGLRELRVKAGQHTIRAFRNGQVVRQELVTITRNGREVVRISQQPNPLPAPAVDKPVIEQSQSNTYKNGLGMEFVLIPKGKVWLGGGGGIQGDVEFELSEDLYLGTHEVTQEQWLAVTKINPSRFSRGVDNESVKDVSDADLKRFPVENVSWKDVQLFVAALNEIDRQSGWVYRMPTVAEWEYACRGGPGTKQESSFHFYFQQPTNQLQKELANYHLGRSCAVGSYAPNRLGLYDMHGNVVEWCDDESLDRNAIEKPAIGGAWSNRDDQHVLFASRRGYCFLDFRSPEHGLRVARVRVDSTTQRKNTLSVALGHLRRDRIPVEALALAGDGDPNKAPARLVAALGDPQPVHHSRATGVTFSPDGRLLATSSEDQDILLLDAAGERVLRILRGHQSKVTSIAFTKDSKTLVSASKDGTIKFWPTETDAAPDTVDPTVGEIQAMAASADSRFLAVAGTKGPLKLWKWGQWDSPVSIGTDHVSITTLAFSSDGKILASAWDEGQAAVSIQIHQTEKAIQADGPRTPMHTLAGHKQCIRALTFSSDGTLLASAGGHPQIKIWNPEVGELISETTNIPDGFGPAQSATFTPNDQKLIFTMQGGPPLVLLDLTMQSQQALPGGTQAEKTAFSPDGQTFAVALDDGGLYLAEANSWVAKHHGAGHRHFLHAAIFCSDGAAVLSAGDDSTVRRWDLRHARRNDIHRQFKDSVGLLRSSSDGRTFAAVAYPVGHGTWANVSDSRTGQERFNIEASALTQLVYSPDGKMLVAGYGNMFWARDVRFLDTSGGKEIHRLLQTGQWRTMALDTEGRTLAGLDLNANFVKMWDVDKGNLTRDWKDSFNPDHEFVPAAAFSPSLGLLAVGCDNGTISLWDVTAGTKIRTLVGHTKRVRDLKFAPDGKRLISSAHDGTIRLWNPEFERAREVISLGSADGALALDLDPSGEYLIACGGCPLIFILRLDP